MKQRFYFDTSVFGGVFDKEFDTVKTFRAIKEKLSLEMATMNFEQIKEYLKANSKKLQA